MLSRVAESIFWINRYMERVENYARFISVNYNMEMDLPPDVEEQWEPLIITTADDELFYKYYDTPDSGNVVHFLTFDQRNPNSIVSNLARARESARTIRESITREMWEQINRLYLQVQETSLQQKETFTQPHDFFDEIKRGVQLFFGIVESSLTRGEAWHFSRMGRYLERGDKTARILDIKFFILLPDLKHVGSPLDITQWTSVLKSASAYNMYRQQYRNINPAQIAEFLLLDRKFPRSVLHCLRNTEHSLRELSGSPPGIFAHPAEKKIGQLRAEMEFMESKDIFDIGLHEFLDHVQIKSNEISDEIYNAFFAIRQV